MSIQQLGNQDAFAYYARLQRVREYVEHHLSDDLSLGRVARVAGLERRYFSSFFHKKTGVRFTEWVTSCRIERAMHQLTKKNYAISNVAFAVGFQDVRTFQRAFKKLTGMTPRDYKRAVRPS